MDYSHKLVFFNSVDDKIRLPVNIGQETVWLNRNQMAELFDRDVKTIGKHINNAIKEELKGISVVANFATTASDGKSYNIDHYNLDVIISVGYRVKSVRGVEFRRWANDVLKRYILHGHAINHERLKQLGQVIKLLKRSEIDIDTSQVLSVVSSYTKALGLLTNYDHQELIKPEGRQTIYRLTYDECRNVISQIMPSQNSQWFGIEKDDSFHSSINAIFQTFSGRELYPSLEEKAANLLYFITKNHSFTDGNKRIDDHTLVAITILSAVSRTDEKELMINLIMNMIA